MRKWSPSVSILGEAIRKKKVWPWQYIGAHRHFYITKHKTIYTPRTPPMLWPIEIPANHWNCSPFPGSRSAELLSHSYALSFKYTFKYPCTICCAVYTQSCRIQTAHNQPTKSERDRDPCQKERDSAPYNAIYDLAHCNKRLTKKIHTERKSQAARLYVLWLGGCIAKKK